MSEVKEFKGRAVLKIRSLGQPEDYNKESKLANQQYQRFIFLDKVFISNTLDTFGEQFKNGEIYSIDLLEGKIVQDNGESKDVISLVGWTTHNQEKKMAISELTLATIASGKINTEISEERLLAMQEEV